MLNYQRVIIESSHGEDGENLMVKRWQKTEVKLGWVTGTKAEHGALLMEVSSMGMTQDLLVPSWDIFSTIFH